MSKQELEVENEVLKAEIAKLKERINAAGTPDMFRPSGPSDHATEEKILELQQENAELRAKAEASAAPAAPVASMEESPLHSIPPELVDPVLGELGSPKAVDWLICEHKEWTADFMGHPKRIGLLSPDQRAALGLNAPAADVV